MRRYLVFSMVALCTAALNGVTWADMDEMGGMPPSAPAADSGTGAPGAAQMTAPQGSAGSVNPQGGMGSGGAMGMCCMGKMGGMTGGMAPPSGSKGDMKGASSTMPGQPGASHLYHVGATGFFLDYSTAIKLTTDQQAALNGIKGKSMGDLGAAQHRIDQAEQELWMLTGSDRPDSMTLEMKVRDIEKLKGDQRIAFIRSVGEAARVLTDDQRAALLGTGAPGAAQMTAPQGSAGSVNPQGGMGSTDPKAGMAGMGDDSMSNMGGGKTPNTKSNNGGMGDM